MRDEGWDIFTGGLELFQRRLAASDSDYLALIGDGVRFPDWLARKLSLVHASRVQPAGWLKREPPERAACIRAIAGDLPRVDLNRPTIFGSDFGAHRSVVLGLQQWYWRAYGLCCAQFGPPDDALMSRLLAIWFCMRDDLLLREVPRRDDLPAGPRPIRVGFLFNRLDLGGAEIWLDTLVSHRDHRIEWSGVNLWLPGSDESMKSRLARKVTVSEGDATKLADRSDILVAWNVDSIAERVPFFDGPVVLVSHGAGDWSADMARLAGSRATHFVAISDAAGSAFDGLNVDYNVILNGVDPSRVEATNPREATREAWGLTPDEIAIGYVGRYSWEKNPLAAALACADLGPRYVPVYVGDGWRRDDVLRALEQAHPRPIVLPRVEHVGDVLAALDCYVLASPSEGFPLGMIEAWLAGVPVVATPVGALPGLERLHGQLVRRVPVCPSPRELADAVVAATSDEHAAVVDRARRVANANYTAAKMGRRWAEYLVCVLYGGVPDAGPTRDEYGNLTPEYMAFLTERAERHAAGQTT